MMRKWNWVLFVLTIILCVAIFYINFSYYAGVIGMGFFGGLLGLSLFFGVYGLFKKKKSRRILFVNGGIIALIIIMFIIAIPRYTYDDARQIASSHYVNQRNTDSVVMPILDKTVPSKSHFSWLLNNRLYYVGIKDDQENQIIHYVVDPVQGKLTKLDEPYWKSTS
ncbi:hypothetical protein [Tuberibacillus sp. Marseille-P3662]|uniref:hypothetical protein n=1 Tax=Tuberibacillus sp. Marseille-P3662 TaxID=1965358 RepID=UPI00111C1BE0|nr:hypothetical protein [Tuberibacillus sp. Marseille-P3662]